jgi:hypothetical protein
MSNYKKSVVLACGLLALSACSEKPDIPLVGEAFASPISHKEGLPFSLSIPHGGSELVVDNADVDVSFIKSGPNYDLSFQPVWFDGKEHSIKRIKIPVLEKRGGQTFTHVLEVQVEDRVSKPKISVAIEQVQPRNATLIDRKKGRYEIKADNTTQVSVPFTVHEDDGDMVELSSSGSWKGVQITHVEENVYTLNFPLPRQAGNYLFKVSAKDHEGSSSLSFAYKPEIMPEIRINGLVGVTLKAGTVTTFQYDKAFEGQADEMTARLVNKSRVPFSNEVWSDVKVNQTSSTIILRIDSSQRKVQPAYLEVVVKKEGLTFKDYYAVSVAK